MMTRVIISLTRLNNSRIHTKKVSLRNELLYLQHVLSDNAFINQDIDNE